MRYPNHVYIHLNYKYALFNFSMGRLLWTPIVHMIWYNTTDLIKACFLGLQSLYIGGIAFSMGKLYQWITRFKRQLQNTFPLLFFRLQSISQFKYGNTACQILLDTWILQQNISAPTAWISNSFIVQHTANPIYCCKRGLCSYARLQHNGFLWTGGFSEVLFSFLGQKNIDETLLTW